jgi:hypothetical protein
MSEQLILEKLDDQAERLQNIEKAISIIAVQDVKILNIQSQVSSLWQKYDDAFSPEGVVTQIKLFQAGCPRETIDKTLKRQDNMIKFQWLAISLLVTIIGSKTLGII